MPSPTLENARREARARKRAEAEAQPAGPDWPALVPLDAPKVPPPAFPLDVLPPRMGDLVRSTARVVTSPVDSPAAYMLALTAGAIGAQVEVEIKRGYRERSCLYVAAVGS